MIGEIFPSNGGGMMEVIEYVGERKYLVRFRNTGTEVVARIDAIKKGRVKDNFAPSVAEKGYLGNSTTTTNPKIYARWKRMIQSCYDPFHLDYPSVGGKGVIVAERWLSYENYEKDILSLLAQKGNPESYRIFRKDTVFSLETTLLSVH